MIYHLLFQVLQISTAPRKTGQASTMLIQHCNFDACPGQQRLENHQQNTLFFLERLWTHALPNRDWRTRARKFGLGLHCSALHNCVQCTTVHCTQFPSIWFLFLCIGIFVNICIFRFNFALLGYPHAFSDFHAFGFNFSCVGMHSKEKEILNNIF